jgi:hypothetical protein
MGATLELGCSGMGAGRADTIEELATIRLKMIHTRKSVSPILFGFNFIGPPEKQSPKFLALTQDRGYSDILGEFRLHLVGEIMSYSVSWYIFRQNSR